ncbi:hypothetical protein [Neomegalonema sp.]|uniref:hypothetical protein n=1 Tax=Neomegalonema sp. TaxID=2039713 RepID=UPI0026114DCF|nr:hypothetical protein [Neomegalonema sp.]MDD2868025.1 hypothetical protein [Neomegalonema sp.]
METCRFSRPGLPQLLRAAPRDGSGDSPDDDLPPRRPGTSSVSPSNPFPPGDHRRDCFWMLGVITSWSLAVRKAEIVPSGTRAKERRDFKQISREDMMAMMTLLAYSWDPRNRFDAPPDAACFSLNSLATIMDAPRVPAMSNTLRQVLLPAALRCDLVCGFQPGDCAWENDLEKRGTLRHKIHISEKGLALVRVFLDIANQSMGE